MAVEQIKNTLARNFVTFKTASWLGWQMDSNWADPFLFIIYTIVKPISATFILVMMYVVVSGGSTSGPLFGFMYVGNAFYMYIFQILFGVTWVIHDDREHFQTIRYIYIAPSSFYAYVLGRSMSKLILTTVSVAITLAFGILFLGVPIGPGTVNIPMFLVVFFIGLASIVVFGLALAGISFLTAEHGMGMNEGLAGIFYLFAGVLYPIGTLPAWGAAFSKIIPLTYWLEGIRRSLIPTSTDPSLAAYSSSFVVYLMIISTIIFLILSIGIFREAEHLARKQGKVDMLTSY